MNYDKLYNAQTNNYFSDLSLILTDGINKISLNVHKIILYTMFFLF